MAEDEDELEAVEDERELEVTGDEVELKDVEDVTLKDGVVVLGGTLEEVDEGVELAGLDEAERDDEVDVLGEMLEDVEDIVELTELEESVLDDEGVPLPEVLKEVDEVVKLVEPVDVVPDEGLAALCERLVEVLETGLDKLEEVCASLLEEVTVLWLGSDVVAEELGLGVGKLIVKEPLVKDNDIEDIAVEELVSNELVIGILVLDPETLAETLEIELVLSAGTEDEVSAGASLIDVCNVKEGDGLLDCSDVLLGTPLLVDMVEDSMIVDWSLVVAEAGEELVVLSSSGAVS
ncbi:hypothetical protein KC343_g835 [Hortaea werneckii]|nr:hypothetical protein KC352_g12413 [Hortaea werneckii]KAI7571682.1 hypothetical protein KC317_g1424 [Hortaea werneckii]KAI7626936.1 hypothetical protein KC346_g998 [Hortaea werneckii]KAI7637213.1 hypothetical protein KC343_g835 [Hortaea werneckii]KAI7678740.1 hypothetical protein KC319_g3152 [Hortaea werneckii]